MVSRPFTSTGLEGNEWPIKPDVVLEGGNLAISGPLTDASVPSLCALTTSHWHTHGQPLGQLAMTSEASARAAHLAARIKTQELRFSLVVSVFGPGAYAAIKPRIEAEALVSIEV